MNKKVEFPQNALPLSPDLLKQVSYFESKDLYWLSGYCSGLADAKSLQNQPLSLTNDAGKIEAALPLALQTVVLYASQSGNAQQIATSLHHNLSQKGVKAELASVADFKVRQLKEQQVILLVASTHGEGEPPDDALAFHEFIQSKRAPRLTGVHHAVLSLGDSSYEFFCQTGKDFDQAFSKLGSTPLLERVDCDLDYQTAAEQWIANLVEKVAALNTVPVSVPEQGATQSTSSISALNTDSQIFTRDNPFVATILENQPITGSGSSKRVNHIEIDLAGSGLEYQPGDALGVWAKNNPATVDSILQITALNGDEAVQIKNTELLLRVALSENLEISLLNKELLVELADLGKSETLKIIADDGFAEYIRNHQLLDVLQLAPVKLGAQQLVDLLKPIKPRMYSIASSLQAQPDEVHLTVALQRSENEFGERLGTASHYLLETLTSEDEVKVFVEPNRHFKLPQDDTPIIMIGPGTGVAPFRAFLQEREARGASGDNWLFFGNPHFNTDFLYQLEWQDWLKNKLLTRLDVAFSRDQAEKVYVQDRLLENAAEIWQWIEQRQAVIYVCGDMSRMAKDVEGALLQIIREQGQKSEAEATALLKSLKQAKRYQRDVY